MLLKSPGLWVMLSFTQSSSLVYSTYHHRFTPGLILNPITKIYGLVLLALLPVQFLLVKFKIHGPIAYFCAMNAAMLIGHFRYLKGVSSSVWEPTKRIQE